MKEYLNVFKQEGIVPSRTDLWTAELEEIRTKLANLNYLIVKSGKSRNCFEIDTNRLRNTYRRTQAQLELLKASINTVSAIKIE